MRNVLLSLLVTVSIIQSHAVKADKPLYPIRVHGSGRLLEDSAGQPFFWLGDTAWEMIHRLSREEVGLYMKNRTEKGFNVIQTVVLAEVDGLNTPNFYGHLPYTDGSYSVPNERYFSHVDFVIATADSLGICIGLLPSWGDKFNLQRGTGPQIFDTPEKAFDFGRFLGERYKDHNNIIWILGGDRNPYGKEDIIRGMARGIATGIKGREDYSSILMTYHPEGWRTSSEWFHNEEWLSFNMQQNGHAYANDVWYKISSDHNKYPVKPVIDGEPIYEEHPIDFKREELGTSDAMHVRRFFYHEVMAGACGFTYGCHAVWQMWDPEKHQPVNGPMRSWQESLSLPGAEQVSYGKKLFVSRPQFSRIPDQNILSGSEGSGHERVSACRDTGGSYILVYSERGKDFTVDLNSISGRRVRASWFDVRTGEITSSRLIKINERNNRYMKFTPPSEGPGHDWVLILDDTSYKYPLKF